MPRYYVEYSAATTHSMLMLKALERGTRSSDTTSKERMCIKEYVHPDVVITIHMQMMVFSTGVLMGHGKTSDINAGQARVVPYPLMAPRRAEHYSLTEYV
ncbi:hypothetical protein G7054_g10537 [Neopestalotiopsis clavispora]|nr:hypothetical protein G7054_g10537 [Neopestalotiopsis clavispora]